MKDLLSLQNWNNDMIIDLISYASEIKNNPEKYFDILKNKTMLMIFEKPSLRTRVSFEVGMTQLGGHAIFLDAKDSPLGDKESISDTAKVSSRYCDIMMARLFKQEHLEEFSLSLLYFSDELEQTMTDDSNRFYALTFPYPFLVEVKRRLHQPVQLRVGESSKLVE